VFALLDCWLLLLDWSDDVLLDGGWLEPIELAPWLALGDDERLVSLLVLLAPLFP